MVVNELIAELSKYAGNIKVEIPYEDDYGYNATYDPGLWFNPNTKTLQIFKE